LHDGGCKVGQSHRYVPCGSVARRCGQAMRPTRLLTDLVADGYKLVSIIAPLLSVAFTVAKFFEYPSKELVAQASYAWAFAPLTVWLLIAYVRRHAHTQSNAVAVYDMHPREVALYMANDARWGEQFKDKKSWYDAVEIALRDELRKGRRLKAEGRPSGKWGDGTFRYPADFIEREFWKQGNLNWIRLINADYHGDIDAYNHGYGDEPKKSFDDVKFCRDEVMAIWPPRSKLGKWLRATPFTVIEKPPYGPPPGALAPAPTEERILPLEADGHR